jgi:hypothetical protein
MKTSSLRRSLGCTVVSGRLTMSPEDDRPILRLSYDLDAAVVKLPERRTPGVVVQGDSLTNLLSILHDAAERILEGKFEEGLEFVDEAREILSGYLGCYKRVVRGE